MSQLKTSQSDIHQNHHEDFSIRKHFFVYNPAAWLSLRTHLPKSSAFRSAISPSAPYITKLTNSARFTMSLPRARNPVLLIPSACVVFSIKMNQLLHARRDSKKNISL